MRLSARNLPADQLRLTGMKNSVLGKACVGILIAAGFGPVGHAQQEGLVRTQALVVVQSKSTPPSSAANVTVQAGKEKAHASQWEALAPGRAQVAVLIDDGLRESIGRNLSDLRTFLTGLPPGLEVLVGYMQNGTVAVAQPFTTDHEQAASSIRLPEGLPGISASPYFCLSDFVKHWPGDGGQVSGSLGAIDQGASGSSGKARIVLMISNGVDPYNGSTSVMNQDSPYVDQAITDAQKEGVAVYTLYFTDAGIRGPQANFSGQSYLQMLADATGGLNLFEGEWNSPSLLPYLKDFTNSLSRTYIATFEAPAGKEDMVRLKVSAPGAKLRAPNEVVPGNKE